MALCKIYPHTAPRGPLIMNHYVHEAHLGGPEKGLLNGCGGGVA